MDCLRPIPFILVIMIFWVFPMSSASPVTEMSSGSPYLDIRDFQVSVGVGKDAATRAANYSKFRDAVLNAILTGKKLILPAGTLEVDVPARASIVLNGDVEIRGQAKELTTLKVGPDANDRGYTLFDQNARTNVAIRDIHIAGPKTRHTNFDTDAQNRFINFNGSSGTLTLRSVIIDGGFMELITSSSTNNGTGIVEIYDSFLHADSQVAAFFAGKAGKKFHAYRTTFADSGIWWPSKKRYGGHTLYIHPTVSLVLEDCIFDGFKRLALHHFGTSISLSEHPADNVIRRCVFRNQYLTDPHSSPFAVELSSNSATLVENCQFLGLKNALVYRGSAIIRNCIFTGSQGHAISPSVDGVVDDVTVKVEGCRFVDYHGYAAIGAFAFTGEISGQQFTALRLNITISNCNFENYQTVATLPFTRIIDTGLENNTTLVVENCRASAKVANVVQGIRIRNKSARITNCVFDGSFMNGDISTEGAYVADLVITGNIFLNNTPKYADITFWHTSPQTKISGSDNKFSGKIECHTPTGQGCGDLKSLRVLH